MSAAPAAAPGANQSKIGEVSDGATGEALMAADEANRTADGKVKTEAELDNEAHNLLAEFDSLMDDMSSLGGAPAAASPPAPQAEAKKEDASHLMQ